MVFEPAQHNHRFDMLHFENPPNFDDFKSEKRKRHEHHRFVDGTQQLHYNDVVQLSKRLRLLELPRVSDNTRAGIDFDILRALLQAATEQIESVWVYYLFCYGSFVFGWVRAVRLTGVFSASLYPNWGFFEGSAALRNSPNEELGINQPAHLVHLSFHQFHQGVHHLRGVNGSDVAVEFLHKHLSEQLGDDRSLLVQSSRSNENRLNGDFYYSSPYSLLYSSQSTPIFPNLHKALSSLSYHNLF